MLSVVRVIAPPMFLPRWRIVFGCCRTHRERTLSSLLPRVAAPPRVLSRIRWCPNPRDSMHVVCMTWQTHPHTRSHTARRQISFSSPKQLTVHTGMSVCMYFVSCNTPTRWSRDRRTRASRRTLCVEKSTTAGGLFTCNHMA